MIDENQREREREVSRRVQVQTNTPNSDKILMRETIHVAHQTIANNAHTHTHTHTPLITKQSENKLVLAPIGSRPLPSCLLVPDLLRMIPSRKAAK